MKLAIFGLTISSSWGNGHATLWRGMCKSLGRLGVDVVFFERDVSYYAQQRDCACPEGATLVLYDNWQAIRERVRRELHDADAAIVTRGLTKRFDHGAAVPILSLAAITAA